MTKSSLLLFHRLIREYALDEAMWLIDSGEVNPDERGPGDESMLLKCAGSGDVKLVAALLSHGCDINQVNSSGRTPLMKAAGGGHVDVVKMILQHSDIDVLKKDVNQKTALDWARLARHATCAESIQAFIRNYISAKRQVDRNAKRLSALDSLVFEVNRRYTTELKQIVSANNLDEMEVFLDTVNLTRRAFEKASNEKSKLQRIESSDETYFINTATPGGVTALSCACAGDRPDLVSNLITNGADMNAIVLKGHSLLTWTCACGNYEVVRVLIARSAKLDFKTPTESKTALIHAAYNSHSRIAMLLVDTAMDMAMAKRKCLMDDLSLSELDDNVQVKDWSSFFLEFIHHKDTSGRDAMTYAKLNGNLDIVSILEEAEARVEERKSRIARERELTKIVECGNRCGFQDRADRINQHEMWNCSCRIIQCTRACGAQVSASDLQQHLKESCAFRMVLCRNVYKGCTVRMRQVDIVAHERHKCRWRQASCRLECGERMHHDDLSNHETNECRLRVVRCENSGCGEYMKWETLANHQHRTCVSRLVICTVGCGRRMPWVERQHHEENECIQPCKFHCGTKLGPPDKLQVHENYLCGNRIVACRYACGVDTLVAKNRDTHETNECVRRPVPCSLGCKEVLEFRDMSEHITNERGTCPFRMLPCLLDYVGRRVNIMESQSGETQIGFVVSFDESTFKHTIMLENKTLCCNISIDLFVCDPIDFITWGCGMMKECERLRHLNVFCSKRNLTCSNGCGQIMAAEYLELHVSSGCTKRMVPCSNANCEEMLVWADRWQHEHESCLFQKIKCPCGEWQEKFEIANHQIVSCPASLVRCVLGCTQYVCRGDMNTHVENQCPKREIGCRFGCGITQLWAEEEYSHNQICNVRNVTCSDCSSIFQANTIDAHRTNVCPSRLIQCDCLEMIRLDELANHHTTLCVKRKRSCAMGCGEVIPDDEMEYHEDFLCDKRVEDCRLGCGVAVRMDFRDNHETHDCSKRVLMCKYLCGDTIHAEGVELHESICLHRVVPCGAGSKGCQRKLISWMTGDVFNGRGRLVRCEAHGETAFSYAAMKGDLPLIRVLLTFIGSDPEPETVTRTYIQFNPVERDRKLRTRLDSVITQESTLGHSSLTWACTKGHLEIVKLFIHLGANLESETSKGRTALLEAVGQGHIEIVKQLLHHGVNTDVKSSRGMNAITLASRMKHKTMLEILEDQALSRKDQAVLYHHLTLNDVNTLEQLLEVGEPHVANQLAVLEERCRVLQCSIEDVDTEEEELLKLKAEHLPLFEKRAAELTAIELEASILNQSIQELCNECLNIETKQLAPIMGKAKLALQLIRFKDLQRLGEITEATEDMNSVMKGVCTLLGVQPLLTKDPLHSLETVQDFWTPGRLQLLFKRETKNVLIYSLNGTIQHERILELGDLECFPVPSFNPVAFQESFGNDEDVEDMDDMCVLDVLNLWVRAIEAHNRLKGLKINDLKAQEAKLRTELNKLLIKVSSAQGALRFANNKLITATQPLECISSERQEFMNRLQDTNKQLHCYKLLTSRTTGGHTALSWAAMYGNVNVLSLLLEKGSPVEYEDDQITCAANILQLLARQFLNAVRRPKWTTALAMTFRQENIAFSLQLKEAAHRHRELRRTIRSPLSHAVFNGHVDAVKLLLSWGARLHRQSLVFPAAPIPYRFPSPWGNINDSCGSMLVYAIEEDVVITRQPSLQVGEDDEEIAVASDEKQLVSTIQETASAGLRYQGCCSWVYKQGWTTNTRYVEMVSYVDECYEGSLASRGYLLEKESQRLEREKEKAKQVMLNNAVVSAIHKEDFKKVVALVDEGAFVDYETPELHTALSYASWRGTRCVNKDSQDVLAVELLLDRAYRVPNVNRIVGIDHTALSLAARAGRTNVMEVLLTRGALVDVVLADGKTALLHGAIGGKWESCRLLIERGADIHHRDKQGRTAVEHARLCNFVGVMQKLASAAYRFLGDAVAIRGEANQIVSCSWGCGAIVRKYPKSYFLKTNAGDFDFLQACDDEFVVYHENHLCPKRVVECVHQCGIKQLWQEELEEHITLLCPCRPVQCNECKLELESQLLESHLKYHCLKRRVRCLRCDEPVILEKMPIHDKSDCIHRTQLCECEVAIPWSSYSDHRRFHCTERNVTCRMPGCAGQMKAKTRESHEQLHCPHRIVPCQWNCENGCKYFEKARHEAEVCEMRPVGKLESGWYYLI